MHNAKYIQKNIILLAAIFLSFLLIGCNESGSDSDNPKSFEAETTWYKDADGDGYGDPSAELTQAGQPVGYVNNSGDCADYDSDIYPGAIELCDGKDNNCSGVADENACGPESQKIFGRLANLNEAQAFVNADSYLQLVPYPANGQMAFTTDGQGRRIYTSDLARIDIPAAAAFTFETFSLVSGNYVIAAQMLNAYGAGAAEVPILVNQAGQPVIISVSTDGEALTIDLGNVRLPVPSITLFAETAAPAMPTGVSASDGEFEDKIRVTWNASANAASYEVYRAASFGGQKTKVATVAATIYNDMSLPCGEDYYYWVKAVNASGASDLFYSDLGFIRCPVVPEPQAVVEDIIDDGGDVITEPEAPPEDPADKPVALDTPTGTEASDGAYPDKITITWKAVAQATSYDIYRTAGDCCGLKVKIGTSNDTSHEDFDVSIGDYYYWIKANNVSSTSEFSFPDGGHIMTRPFAPTGVQASDGTYYSKVLVSWDPAPSQIFSYNGPCCPPLSDKRPKTTSYEIYRAMHSSAPKTLIGTTSANQFFDTDLECSTCCPDTFVYWVKAVNAAGTSNFSAEDTGFVYRTLRDPVPSATDGKGNCVWVSWDPVSGAVRYDVYRSDSEDGEKIKICTIDKPCDIYKYRDVTTTCPKVYYYWVKAIDAKGYTSCEFGDFDTGYCVAE